MINNEADDRYEGTAAILRARDIINRTLPVGQADNMLDDLVFNNDTEDGVLILHPDNDPLRRIWSLQMGTLNVSRVHTERPYGEDLKFYDTDVQQGILTYVRDHGDDALLSLLSMSAIFQDGDVFTIHYDSERKLEPWWTLETADNLLFKKPKAYEKKDEPDQNSPVC